MLAVIDPGHGAADPGAVSGALREKDLTLAIALAVARELSRREAAVRLTRLSDAAVSLAERVGTANSTGAALFLSVHVNAGGGSGFESFVHPSADGRTRLIRSTVHRKVAAVFAEAGFSDRGEKQADLYVLRRTRMPAVLLEYGFIDRPRDAAFLADAETRDRLARATADGVAEAFGLSADPSPPADSGFPDGLDLSEWAKDARDWAVRSGVSDGERPKDPATREEVWVMLHRLAQKTGASG